MLVASTSRRRLNSAVCTGNTTTDAPSCQWPVDIIKERFYSVSGPSSITNRPEKVDDRMKSLSNRNAETPGGRRCVGETAQLWTPDLAPVATGSAYYLSCEEDMGALKLFFGLVNNMSYIVEIQNSATGLNGAVHSRTVADSNDPTVAKATHIWTIGSLYSDADYSSWQEIYAEPNSNMIEVSFATNEQGNTGIGCGVNLKSSAEYVYVEGKFADGNCGAVDVTKECADATTLTSVDLSLCSSINAFEHVTSLTAATAASGAPTAASLVNTYGGLPSLGLTNFNVQ